MIHRFVFLLISSFISFQLHSAVNLPELLHPLIEEELALAKLALDKNKVSSKDQIKDLKDNLDAIWLNINNKGISESNGFDEDLRPAYVTMQGIIESAITKALETQIVGNAIIHIITPRMPTPLILKTGNTLDKIDLKDPNAFAKYRNPILINFLKAGGAINAFYSHNAHLILSERTAELNNFASYCNKYNNLSDQPYIKINHSDFPTEMTGAVYLVDGLPITIESRQVTQIDNLNQQLWAIKFEENAKLRKNEVDAFLERFF